MLDSHPYDLSGGEQQKVALAKVLLLNPKIILLNVFTKGIDAYSKKILADVLQALKKRRVAVVMVTHDIEFSAQYSDRCAMFMAMSFLKMSLNCFIVEIIFIQLQRIECRVIYLILQ
ncbi:ATP-binding cassette domain-containing protein [Viridibacillus sp. NPDC096237]|uniref:ATP-binding cassette domain-containing protein n=1 Tax=Viridibacillus sp. NPDC096237 TaxID=3390721 RepID=UPI003D01A929